MADEFTQNPDAAHQGEPNQETAGQAASGIQDQIKQAAGDFANAAAAKADDLRAAASLKAEEYRNAAAAKADDLRAAASLKAEEYRGKAEAAYADAKVRAQHYHEDGEAYVRENPTRAIVGAVVAGFVLGLLIRK